MLQIPDMDEISFQIILRPLKSKTGAYGGAFAFINPLDEAEHSASDTPSPEPGIMDITEQRKKIHQELITICANCKNIKDADDVWRTPEAYFSHKLQVHFSHTICPVCIKDLYPGLMP